MLLLLKNMAFDFDNSLIGFFLISFDKKDVVTSSNSIGHFSNKDNNDVNSNRALFLSSNLTSMLINLQRISLKAFRYSNTPMLLLFVSYTIAALRIVKLLAIWSCSNSPILSIT